MRELIERLRDEDVVLSAAGLAFYALVSVAPLVVLSLRLATLLVGDDAVRRAGDELARLAPGKLGIDKAFTSVAEAGTGIGFTAALIALWPASAYGAGLVRAFDRLTGADRQAPGLRGRLLSLVVLGVLPVFVLATLGLVALAPRFLGRGVLPTIGGWLLGVTAAFAMLTAFHALVYRVFAPKRPNPRRLLEGAVTAAAGVTLLSLAYAAYLQLAADFGSRYITSGLAAVVLLAVWLYLANGLLLVGYRGVVAPAPRKGAKGPARKSSKRSRGVA